MSPAQVRSNMLAIATSYLERKIQARLDAMREAGERIELDPDASAVIELREHCKREIESDRQRKACPR